MRSLLGFRIPVLLFLISTSLVSFADDGDVSKFEPLPDELISAVADDGDVSKFETLPNEMISAAADDGDASKFEMLPNEMISEVMCYLPLKSLANLMATKKIFLKLGENNPSWRFRCTEMGFEHIIYTPLWPWYNTDTSYEEHNERIRVLADAIRTISSSEIADLTWKELYFYMKKLSSSIEEFQRIEAASLSSDGLLSTVGCSLWEGTKAAAFAVPALVLGGGIAQTLGAGCVVLSVPMIIHPMLSVGLFSVGATYFVCGSLMEATACFVPALSPVIGYHVHKKEKEKQIRLARRNFKRRVWMDLSYRFGQQKMPSILLIYAPY